MGDEKVRQDIKFIALIAGVWLFIFPVYSIFLHIVFRTTSLDLGMHSQLIWNLARGRFMQTSFMNHSFAGNHFWPLLYVFVPVYEFFGIYGLLIVQCVIAASGVFPVYSLTYDITNSKAWARVLSFAYLALPTISMGVLFDFHTELISIPVALQATLMLRRNKKSFWFWAFTAILLYEVNAIIFSIFGIGLLFRKGRRITGSVLAGLSMLYLVVIFFLIMPAFKEEVTLPHWERYSHLGKTPAEALIQIITHPIETVKDSISSRDIRQISFLFLSVGFLPFMSLKYMMPALPVLLALILSNWEVQMDVRHAYYAPVIPCLILSSVHGAGFINELNLRKFERLRKFASIISFTIILCAFLYIHIEHPKRPFPFLIRANLSELREAITFIPPGASVSADNHLGPRLANREVLLLTPMIEYRSKKVEYIFTDLLEEEFKGNYWRKQMKHVFEGDKYVPIYSSRGVIVFKRREKNITVTNER